MLREQNMSERKTIVWLRLSYWIGAVFDALVILPMLSPAIGGEMFGIPQFEPASDYRYAMRIAASLMAGWVFLLLWADRKPAERKGVLILTIFPVLFGLIDSGGYAVHARFVVIEKMLPVWIAQGSLVILFAFSYWKAAMLPSNPRVERA